MNFNQQCTGASIKDECPLVGPPSKYQLVPTKSARVVAYITRVRRQRPALWIKEAPTYKHWQ